MKAVLRVLGINPRSAFLRNLGLMTSANALAQLLNFLVLPITTRLFPVYAFGLQGLFVSTLVPLGVIVNLGMHAAIPLPRDDEEARGLLRLSIVLTLIGGTLIELVLAVAGGPVLTWAGAADLVPYRHLIAVSVVMGALSATFAQYLIRRGQFGIQSRRVLATAAVANGSRVAAGLIAPSGISLVLANVAATTVTLGLYLTTWWSKFAAATPWDWGQLRRLFVRYRSFPLLRTPQVLINALSQAIPIWLLARYFGPATAGQYTIAIAVLGAPTIVLGKAMYDVFYPRLAAARNDGEPTRGLLLRATLGSLAIGFVPCLLVVLFGPEIFSLLFGEAWRRAGEYAQWLAPWCILQLVNRPAVAATAVLEIQGWLLVYELFSTGTKVVALWVGFTVFGSDLMAVALFSIVGIIAYLCLIGFVILTSSRDAVGRSQEA